MYPRQSANESIFEFFEISGNTLLPRGLHDQQCLTLLKIRQRFLQKAILPKSCLHEHSFILDLNPARRPVNTGPRFGPG